jgi:hypothetical protein
MMPRFQDHGALHAYLTDTDGSINNAVCPEEGCYWHAELDGYITTQCFARPIDGNVALVMATATKVVQLHVRDAHSKNAILGAWCTCDTGPLRMTARGDGDFDLMASLRTVHNTRIGADNYIDCSISISTTKDVRHIVELSRAAVLKVHPLQSTSEYWAWASWDSRPPTLYLGKAGQDVEIYCPSRHIVAICAVDRTGLGAVREVYVPDSGMRLDLAMSSADSLHVQLVNDDGATVPDALPVMVRYKNGVSLAQRTSTGCIRLGLASCLQECAVSGSCGDFGIAPAWSLGLTSSLPLGGSVTIARSRARSLNLRCIDSSGRPLAGARVTVESSKARETFERLPQLHGSEPTDHPSWYLTEGCQSLVLDDRGQAILSLVSGLYSLDVQLPTPDPLDHGLALGEGPTHFSVTEMQLDIELQFPQFRRIDLVVRSESGAPVGGFSVSADVRDLRSGRAVRGSTWHAFVPSTLRSLRVEAGANGSVEVTLPHDGDCVLVAALERDQPASNGRLRCVSSDVDLPGQRLSVRGLGADGNQLWVAEVELDDCGCAELVVKSPDLTKEVEVAAVDPSVRAHGLQTIWVPNGEIAIQLSAR